MFHAENPFLDKRIFLTGNVIYKNNCSLEFRLWNAFRIQNTIIHKLSIYAIIFFSSRLVFSLRYVKRLNQNQQENGSIWIGPNSNCSSHKKYSAIDFATQVYEQLMITKSMVLHVCSIRNNQLPLLGLFFQVCMNLCS